MKAPMSEHARLSTSPVAHPDAVVSGDHWRITVLTEGLVRLEWSPDGRFEDRASTLALHRDLPVPAYRVTEGAGSLAITTARFTLTYDRGPFTPSGLSLQVAGNVSSYHSVWHYGEPVRDLGGTARTLDNADGRAPLGPGVVSRYGYALLDDSRSMVVEDDGWVSPRDGSRLDLYVFAYGLDYAEAVRAFFALSGPQPLVPRWALGNWWCRYFPYSADGYLELLDRFKDEGVPLSVAALDMDWHPVAAVEPVYGSGWTGYSWNRELFPDPGKFLAELHRRDLRVTLNVHPADGVRAFEDAYAEMATTLGLDPAEGTPIGFDVTDPAFMEAYLGVLHRRLEDQGVDFWWIDWQSGPYSRLAGVDPLWMLNHFHYLDAQRRGEPLILSRYAGPGGHRYPVGFSGDTVISWDSLAFQPEFTATAANIGCGWWSHDIGGHLAGSRDDELTVRWVQLGVFSPILRLHSSSNPFLVKEPWAFPPEARAQLDEALRWRHRLVPYLDTMNHRAAEEGVPLVRPMYHLHPNDAPAYGVPSQFAFGSELLVAPVVTPADPCSTMASVRAWLPPGTWLDLFTGVVYDGPGVVELHRDRSSIPVLMRSGGIVPCDATPELDAAITPERIEVVVAPGADGRFELIEGAARTTLIWDQASGTLHIGGARTWVVTLMAAGASSATADGEPAEIRRSPNGSVSVTARGGSVSFGPDPRPRTSDVTARLRAVLDRAQWSNEGKRQVWALLQEDLPAAATLTRLHAFGLPDGLAGALVELLGARR